MNWKSMFLVLIALAGVGKQTDLIVLLNGLICLHGVLD